MKSRKCSKLGYYTLSDLLRWKNKQQISRGNLKELIDLSTNVCMVYCLCYCTLEYPNCQGQVAIVTGGNKGIGLETVRGLCSADVTVIMGMY